MSISYRIMQLVVWDFSKRAHFLGKWQSWIPLFSQSGRGTKHIEKKLDIMNRDSVTQCLNCCTLWGTEQPQLGNGGSNPVAVNQFCFFYWIHIFSLSIFIWKYSLFYVVYFVRFNFASYVFAPLFFTENEAEIKKIFSKQNPNQLEEEV